MKNSELVQLLDPIHHATNLDMPHRLHPHSGRQSNAVLVQALPSLHRNQDTQIPQVCHPS